MVTERRHGYINKPKRTPGHPKKSHVVKACEGGKCQKTFNYFFPSSRVLVRQESQNGESAKMKANDEKVLRLGTERI